MEKKMVNIKVGSQMESNLQIGKLKMEKRMALYNVGMKTGIRKKK